MSDKNPGKKMLPFWPHYLLSEVVAWYIMFAVLIILAAVLPAGLEDRANALSTPEHVKPEWYFLAVYQFLKVATVFNFVSAEAPRLLGVLLPGFGMALLFLLPFIDRGTKRPTRERPIMIALVTLILLSVIGLTIWGQWS